jgi:hypothetical protein
MNTWLEAWYYAIDFNNQISLLQMKSETELSFLKHTSDSFLHSEYLFVYGQ